MRRLLITLLAVVVTHGAYATAGNDDATSKLYVDTTVATRQDAAPANNANTVMTYTDTAGTTGTKGIYDATGSYAEQQNALVPADVANAAIMNAINMEFKCAEWNPNTEIPETDCWKWQILNPVNPSRNLFNGDIIPNTLNSYGGIINNHDGTFTVTAGPSNSYYRTTKKLSELAPGIEVGKTYILSFKSTTRQYMTLSYYDGQNNIHHYMWYSGTPLQITETFFDATFAFQASTGTTTTISDIQIEEGTVATPYQPYGENTYLPQNQQ